MEDDYEDEETSILCVFKKCSICNAQVMCNLEGNPETHSKECKEKCLNSVQDAKGEKND